MKKMIWMMLSLMVLSAASVNVQAQVTIGSNANPDADAVLDLQSTDKGLLIPRINLATTLTATKKAGLVVYNTGTNGTFTPGFYYNDGTNWIKVGSGSGAVSSVAAGTGITVSGTATAPTVAITPLGVTNGLIADNAVDSFKIKDLSISGADIANATISVGKLASTKADSGRILKSTGTSWTPGTLFTTINRDDITANTSTSATTTWTRVANPTWTNFTIRGGECVRIKATGLQSKDLCISTSGVIWIRQNTTEAFLCNLAASPTGANTGMTCYRPSN